MKTINRTFVLVALLLAVSFSSSSVSTRVIAQNTGSNSYTQATVSWAGLYYGQSNDIVTANGRTAFGTYQSVTNGEIITGSPSSVKINKSPAYLVSNVIDFGAFGAEAISSYYNKTEYRTANSIDELNNKTWIALGSSKYSGLICPSSRFLQWRIKFETGDDTALSTSKTIYATGKLASFTGTIKDTDNNSVYDTTLTLNSTTITSAAGPSEGGLPPASFFNFVFPYNSIPDSLSLTAKKDGYEQTLSTVTKGACQNFGGVNLQVTMKKTTSGSNSTTNNNTNLPTPNSSTSSNQSITASISKAIQDGNPENVKSILSTMDKNELTSPVISSINNISIISANLAQTANKLELDAIDSTNPLNLRGYAKPNSTVKIYLYSDPIEAEAKTGADGTWIYNFSNQLEPGDHRIELEMTNSDGTKSEKVLVSEFVVKAKAAADTAQASTQDSQDRFWNDFNFLMIASASLVFILGLILFFLYKTRKKRDGFSSGAKLN